MIPRKLTGNASVDAIATMAISGNVIPATWYKTITTASGKADLAAINILSDVLYWYRPSENPRRIHGRRHRLQEEVLGRPAAAKL